MSERMRSECCAMPTFLTYICVQLRPNILSGIVIVHSSAMKPSSPITSSALSNNWTCFLLDVIQKTYLGAARETKRQMKCLSYLSMQQQNYLITAAKAVNKALVQIRVFLVAPYPR